MAITAKQERYARLVASGMDLHTAALEAGCKNHEAARKFVADMAKRENVQSLITQLKAANATTPPQMQPKENEQPTWLGSTAGQVAPKKVKDTPLEFLVSVINDTSGQYSPKERIGAAIALLPYTEQKLAQTGKKEDAMDNARAKAENGRFSTFSNQADMFVSEFKS